MKKTNEFFNRLIAYYWTAREFRDLQRSMGMEAFEAVDWQKEAALRFVLENYDECQRIFQHKSFPLHKVVS